MLIPSDLAPEWLSPSAVDEYTRIATQTRLSALSGQETPFYDVTAMPADVRAPFAVGGVYRFLDIAGRWRTALIYTEQHARVDGCWWHVSEVPDDAVCVGTFTPDPALVADAARFAREVVNSQEWS